jgi:hypothetical protein
MKYESRVVVESKTRPGVRVVVRRMSFGRRLDLTRRVQEIAKKLAFLAAAEPDAAGEAERALLGAEIDREYLRWGLVSIEGLEIDGEAATPAALIEGGPEELVREALEAVRREAGLSENERKNCESHSTSSSEAGPDGTATNAAA